MVVYFASSSLCPKVLSNFGQTYNYDFRCITTKHDNKILWPSVSPRPLAHNNSNHINQAAIEMDWLEYSYKVRNFQFPIMIGIGTHLFIKVLQRRGFCGLPVKLPPIITV